MIHRYSMNGLNIVLDVNSGAVHVVDDITYEILGLYPDNNIIEKLKDKYDIYLIQECIDEIEELKINGVLFSSDDFNIKDLPKPCIKALCLHISHDCNLSCEYCFAGDGQYSGKRSHMSFDVGKAAIDFIIANSGTRRNLEIDFFGGEPLMNFDVVKQIVSYARSCEKKFNKCFRFTITTNGILLDDEKIQYINENMNNIVLSIDGRKDVNDNMRKRINGCYDVIVPKYLKIANLRNQDNYYVRGTYTNKNLDFYNDVIHLADLGFKQISVEPVVADSSKYYALTNDDLPVLFEQYELLANEIVKRNKKGNGFNFFHFMIDLTGGPCIAKRVSGCGAGYEYLAVTPTGDLFPCHQFVGNDNFKMGSLFDGITNTYMQNTFSNCNVYKKQDCLNCFAKFYCSGGCAANSFNCSNDIEKPYALGCALSKKRIECAIYIKCVDAFCNK